MDCFAVPFYGISEAGAPMSAGSRLIRRFLVALGLCIRAYWFYRNVLRGFRLPPVLLS
jgi:hypothetical protein